MRIRKVKIYEDYEPIDDREDVFEVRTIRAGARRWAISTEWERFTEIVADEEWGDEEEWSEERRRDWRRLRKFSARMRPVRLAVWDDEEDYDEEEEEWDNEEYEEEDDEFEEDVWEDDVDY